MSSQKNCFHVYPVQKETAFFVQLAYCFLAERITRKISALLLSTMHCCILTTTLKWLETCDHNVVSLWLCLTYFSWKQKSKMWKMHNNFTLLWYLLTKSLSNSPVALWLRFWSPLSKRKYAQHQRLDVTLVNIIVNSRITLHYTTMFSRPVTDLIFVWGYQVCH